MIDQINNISDEILIVVTSVFNPTGDQIRYKLYQDFKNYINSFSNTLLVTIELAIGDNPFVVTHPHNPTNVQIRTDHVLWYKENLDNILFKKLFKIFKNAKVAWIDADVSFTNENWVNDTLKLLDLYPFVQLFSQCDSLGPRGEVLTSDPSFVYAWLNDIATVKKRGRPGGAWASTLEMLDQTGYLIDWDILGASDWFHTFALTNQTPATITPCREKNERHAARIKEIVNGNVTCLEGTLIHYFHGYPSDRGYGTRGKILIDNDFDPDVDIGYREDGLIYFKTNKPKLRQDIIEHFKSKKTHGPEDLVPSL